MNNLKERHFIALYLTPALVSIVVLSAIMALQNVTETMAATDVDTSLTRESAQNSPIS